MSPIARLFYLACETRPDLPSKQLLNYLGKSWVQLLTAGSKAGMGAVVANLKDTKVEQVESLYMAGSDSGATPSAEEFRQLLHSVIWQKILEADIGAIDQSQLAGELYQWSQGKQSMTGEYELDWTAEIEQPPFVDCGFFPLNRACGENGVPPEIITIISKPGAGKTTIALALALAWKRLILLDGKTRTVEMMQSEIAPSALLHKVQTMFHPGDKELFIPDVDRMTFGTSAIINRIKYLKENPDRNRLVLFDSATGFCGSGTDPGSRDRFEFLYRSMADIKNSSAFVVIFHHLKRGALDTNMMEAAAGASVIEKLSGVLASLDNRGIVNKSHESYMDLKLTTIKSRYGLPEPDNTFYMNYHSGDLIDTDEELTNSLLLDISQKVRTVGLPIEPEDVIDWS